MYINIVCTARDAECLKFPTNSPRGDEKFRTIYYASDGKILYSFISAIIRTMILSTSRDILFTVYSRSLRKWFLLSLYIKISTIFSTDVLSITLLKICTRCRPTTYYTSIILNLANVAGKICCFFRTIMY